MTPEEAIEKLDEIQPGDNEIAHCSADEILLSVVHENVRKAYERAVDRVGGFWYA